MKFLFENLGVTELDVEFYYDLKSKLLKGIKMQESIKNRITLEEESRLRDDDPSAPPAEQNDAPVQSTSSLHSQVDIFRKKNSLPALIPRTKDSIQPSYKTKKSQVIIQRDSLPNMKRNSSQTVAKIVHSQEFSKETTPRHGGTNSQQSQFTIKRKVSRNSSKNLGYKGRATDLGTEARSINEFTDRSALAIQEHPENKFFKRKPFSWMSQGDSFTMIETGNLYLTNPVDTMEYTGRTSGARKLNKTINSQFPNSLYSKQWEETLPKNQVNTAYLQIKEPYLLRSQAEFYKKVIPERLPPPPPRPQPVSIRRFQDRTDQDRTEVSKYILMPDSQTDIKHTAGDRHLLASDFTRHQLALYDPILNPSMRGESSLSLRDDGVKQSDAADDDDRHFKSVVVQKYVFDNSKRELEAVKKLILYYEMRDYGVLHPNAQKKGLNGDTSVSLGYSKVEFEKENRMINLFLLSLQNQKEIENQPLQILKNIVHKRLVLVTQILENLDYASKIKKYIEKKERNYLNYLNLQNQSRIDLRLVGIRVEDEVSLAKTRGHRSPAKINKKLKMKRNREGTIDSNMEYESSSEESVDRNVQYQRVLSKKVNIDKRKLLELCLGYIRKEVKRIKYAIKVNDLRRKALPNPNRICRTAMGFSENLMNLLKKNKEFLPSDIKADLIKILPASHLKELGGDLFIDDEILRQEMMSEFSSKGDETAMVIKQQSKAGDI